MTIIELRTEIRGMLPAEAIPVISSYLSLHPADDEAYLLRGIRYWSLQQRSAAINDYLAALRINPASPAAEALRAANEILDYRNTDLINP